MKSYDLVKSIQDFDKDIISFIEEEHKLEGGVAPEILELFKALAEAHNYLVMRSFNDRRKYAKGKK